MQQKLILAENQAVLWENTAEICRKTKIGGEIRLYLFFINYIITKIILIFYKNKIKEGRKVDICESFLNAYRDLEEVLAVKYGQRSGTVQLYASKEGSKYFEELNLFREMRNLLSHHGRIDGSPVVLPSQQALDKLLEILEYAKNPPVAMSVATPAEKLCSARLSDEVSNTIGIMEKRGYSHIPVLTKNKGVFGVFSVGTLFSYAKSNPQRAIDGMTLRDMSAYLPPEKHITEKFAFVSPEATLYDIKELFSLTGPNHRRVVAVFVTEDGNKNSPLLGMITPWDVFKAAGSQMI